MAETNDSDPSRDSYISGMSRGVASADDSLQESTVFMTLTDLDDPARICQKLQAAARPDGTAHVLTSNKHVAENVHWIAKHPFKKTTDRGVTPYRTVRRLQTPDGKYVVCDRTQPTVDVEFVAGEGIEITVDDSTMSLPFGDIPEDAFTNLPNGFLLADPPGAHGAWTIMDGDGTEISTVATKQELEAVHPAIRGWFEPDRLSYSGDIDIQYRDPTADGSFTTYENTPTQSSPAPRVTLKQFLQRFSISVEGAELSTGEVFDRYRAWMNTAGQSPPSRTVFWRALAKIGDIETAERTTGGGQKMLCNRMWRFPPTIDR